MRTFIISALFATIAATASAQELVPFDDAFVSQKTRAEVVADMSKAQAQGMTRQQGEITWIPSIADDSHRSRAVVRGEARHAERMSELGTVYSPRYHN